MSVFKWGIPILNLAFKKARVGKRAQKIFEKLVSENQAAGLSKNSGQGQSIDRETEFQNIIDPRVRTISSRDEKVCRYSMKTWRDRIKSLSKQLTGFWGEIEIKDTFGVYVLSDVS